jgi:hypothetical protein
LGAACSVFSSGLGAGIIASGDGESIDLARLMVDAQLTKATAGYCLEAYRSICQALREAKLLPEKPAQPRKAPIAPKLEVASAAAK